MSSNFQMISRDWFVCSSFQTTCGRTLSQLYRTLSNLAKFYPSTAILPKFRTSQWEHLDENFGKWNLSAEVARARLPDGSHLNSFSIWTFLTVSLKPRIPGLKFRFFKLKLKSACAFTTFLWKSWVLQNFELEIWWTSFRVKNCEDFHQNLRKRFYTKTVLVNSLNVDLFRISNFHTMELKKWRNWRNRKNRGTGWT